MCFAALLEDTTQDLTFAEASDRNFMQSSTTYAASTATARPTSALHRTTRNDDHRDEFHGHAIMRAAQKRHTPDGPSCLRVSLYLIGVLSDTISRNHRVRLLDFKVTLQHIESTAVDRIRSAQIDTPRWCLDRGLRNVPEILPSVAIRNG